MFAIWCAQPCPLLQRQQNSPEVVGRKMYWGGGGGEKKQRHIVRSEIIGPDVTFGSFLPTSLKSQRTSA